MRDPGSAAMYGPVGTVAQPATSAAARPVSAIRVDLVVMSTIRYGEVCGLPAFSAVENGATSSHGLEQSLTWGK
jgi:hypothetical protein